MKLSNIATIGVLVGGFALAQTLWAQGMQQGHGYGMSPGNMGTMHARMGGGQGHGMSQEQRDAMRARMGNRQGRGMSQEERDAMREYMHNRNNTQK